MVFCMVALLLPESLWAQTAAVSDNGTKLTITTTAPGQVTSTLVNDALAEPEPDVAASAITEIVLDGKFNSSDLDVIKGASGGRFTGVTSVDMSEARFVSSVSGSTNNYSLFESTTSGTANIDTHAIVGGTLYVSANGSSSWEWEKVNYSDGQNQYVNVRYADEEAKKVDNSWPNNANQYALVGGTEYIYDGTEWKLPSEVTESPNYSLMKFSYWQETLTTAITSKYANETISNEIFQNCKKLTYVDYKAGNVIGFNDHKTNAGYNTNDNTTLLGTGLSVNIGKNVTKINSNAFKECDVLTKLTFDTDYEATNPDMLTGVTYPLNLDINDDAFLQCYNLTGVVFPNRVRSIGNNAFKQAGNNVEEFTVEFERRKVNNGASIDYDVNLTIGFDAFAYCSKLKTISLPIRLVSMGNSIFANSGLEHFVIREDVDDSRLTVIPSDAFLASKLQEVVIPRSVTEIESGAFMNCPTIETVTFQESNMNPQPTLRIRTGAFSGGNEQDQKLKDVYVNIDPSKRLLICEYNAFSFTTMVAQTDLTNDKLARLHFSEEYWDYYAGNWKKGLAFSHDNLNKCKQGYEDETRGYKGIYADDFTNLETTGDYAGKYRGDLTGDDQYTPANGWQQFALTSTSIDIIIPAGSFVRTYSTKKPQVIPTFALVANKPSGVQDTDPLFRIYRISKFEDNYTEGESVTPSIRPVATATEITEEYGERKYIPPYTGVIMVGPQTDVAVLVYLSDIEFVSPAEPYTYGYTLQPKTVTRGDDGNYDITNFLFPACANDENTTRETTADGVERVILNPTYPYPYYGAQPDYRFFALAKNSSNQYYFSRFKKGGFVTRDKAYLKLSKDVFHWSAEGETASGNGTGYLEPGSSQAPIMMSFMDPEGNTTDVRMINPETMTIMDDCYYTLQGVKISGRPTQQGIYIHNGKKVVIK